MWRELPSCQRRVALPGVHMRVSINVLAIFVNHCFSLEIFISFKRLIDTKSIRIDGERLLLVIGGKSRTVDSSADFAGTTYH